MPRRSPRGARPHHPLLTVRGCVVVALLLVGCGRTEAPAKQTCTSCHPTETTEWNASLHRVAFADRDFQASFAVEPAKFCADCHKAAAIGCSSCHGAGHGQPTSDCNGCHEFEFPRRNPQMQSTLSEHAASPFAEVACSSCHMPRREGRAPRPSLRRLAERIAVERRSEDDRDAHTDRRVDRARREERRSQVSHRRSLPADPGLRAHRARRGRGRARPPASSRRWALPARSRTHASTRRGP